MGIWWRKQFYPYNLSGKKYSDNWWYSSWVWQNFEKVGNHVELTNNEKELIDRIGREKPDCLAYHSEAKAGGTCFLFFEQGFKKLSLREVALRLGDCNGRNTAKVTCVVTSDFSPVLEGYGYYFSPIAKIKYDEKYTTSDEYILRKQVEDYSHEQITEMMRWVN